MSSQQKRGFRLPWGADRSTDEGAGAATMEADSADPTTPEQIADGVDGELGDGPFHFADAAPPDASTDASPEAPEVPETTAEAAMIDADTVTTEPAEGASPVTETAWPTTDQRGPAGPESTDEPTPPRPSAFEQAAAATPAPEAVTAERPARPRVEVESDVRANRSNPLVAGLVKAMREAALASREETTGRLQADATAQVELLREAGTARAGALRKQADDDIAGIREWSKSEVARIKQETDDRIESRRTQLSDQTQRHEASVEQQVQQVQATVATFEADMDRFFERLLAENDPAKLAALAEQAPEPPDLAAELAELPDQADGPAAEGATAWGDVAWGDPMPTEVTDPDAGEASVADPAPVLEADAAAEAEAAATEGLDLAGGDVWPTSVLASARRALQQATTEFDAAGVANSRLFVTGLTSVAGISAFKGALGQLSGVRSVSVSSGEPGVFIFTVVHNPETDLQDGVANLTEFSARVTDATDDSLTVVAQEPAA